jgi:hypothetical protein
MTGLFSGGFTTIAFSPVVAQDQPQCPLDVDSSRPECANSGHSATVSQMDFRSALSLESKPGARAERSR